MKKDWEIKTLGEICEVVGGGTPKTAVSEYWSDDIVWVTPKDLGLLETSEISDSAKHISFKGLEKSSAKLLPTGSVVMSSRAPIGYVAIAGVELATNQGCRNFICGNEIFNKFLYYFLFANTKLLNSLGGGATFKEISGSTIKKISILLPPISEQKRIVKILDEKFEAIEKLKKVTEEQLASAKELFSSRIKEIFENKNWKEIQFDDVCVLQRGFDLPTRLRNKGDYPLVSANGITDFIDQSKVSAPGVTTGRSGSIGFVHFIEKNFWPLNTALYIKDFKGNNEKFVYYFLKQFDLGRFSSGAGVPTLNRNNVHTEIVRIPTEKTEQLQVVKELDLLVKNMEELRRVFGAKSVGLEELKKSYLEQAFAGKL